MPGKIMTIGERVGIVLKAEKPSKENENIELVSKLYEIEDETHLVLAMPMKDGITVPLSVGLEIQLNFFSERGIYLYEGKITKRTHEGKLDVIYVEMKSDFERLQRRQFYRIENHMDIEYQLQKGEDHLEGEVLPWIQGKVTDISGGGLCFLAKQQLKSGDVIELRLSFSIEDEYYEYLIACEVIGDKISNHNGFYNNRVQFIDLKIDQRETIIKYIFEMERKFRRGEKGLT